MNLEARVDALEKQLRDLRADYGRLLWQKASEELNEQKLYEHINRLSEAQNWTAEKSEAVYELLQSCAAPEFVHRLYEELTDLRNDGRFPLIDRWLEQEQSRLGRYVDLCEGKTPL